MMTPQIAGAGRTAQWSCLAASMFVATPFLLSSCGSLADSDANSTPPLIDRLTENDMRMADRALQQALSVAISGTTFAWRNDANGHSGTVTPKSSYRTDGGVFCRAYEETVTIERNSELYENTACVDDSGVWKSVR